MITLLKRKIKDHFIRNSQIPTPKISLERLKNNGFKPDIIFDVGAYHGEFAKMCLEIWPKSKVVCFEALEEKIALLKEISEKDHRISVIPGLVGDEDNENVCFNENESASSVLDEYESKNFTKVFHKMRKLETCIKEFILPIPNLLKIDTQGFEYPVLKGIESKLNSIDIILAELNFIDIHKDVKLSHEVIRLLNDYNFLPFDIAQIHRRPIDNAVWQVDYIFVKKNSPLRSNKNWL
ncbi:MAG: FkbM family methyltransferase [Bacteroidia bacterium]|nr:FkbM family methyltransferase [Bacteroidia bacterium]